MTNGTFHRVWRDFEAWQAAVQDDACPDCLRLLLQGRIDYLAKPDPTRWRLAKRLYTAMRAAGVDFSDEDAMDAWVEAFNRRPPADRREVLGDLLDTQPELAHARVVAREGVVAAVDPRAPVPSQVQPDPADEQAGAYPPVTLAEDHELAAAARASILLGRVITLARWVGSGRPVSRRGELIPPDARALEDIHEAGWLR